MAQPVLDRSETAEEFKWKISDLYPTDDAWSAEFDRLHTELDVYKRQHQDGQRDGGRDPEQQDLAGEIAQHCRARGRAHPGAAEHVGARCV